MSTFAKVRKAFLDSLDTNLGVLNVTVVGTHAKGDWRQVKCPLCEDQSGSCDVSVISGHLKCKQCNRSDELFTWTAAVLGLSSTWEACQSLAASLGVAVEIVKRKGKAPRSMDDKILLESTHRLWADEMAEPCRAFLRRRKLDDPEMIEGFGIGYIAGSLTFAQYWPGGGLKKRYRRYTPGAPPNRKWMWSSGTGQTQGLWPVWKPSHNVKILLLEGEWDVLTSWIRLRWKEAGIWAYTWTGGVKPIPVKDLPEWMKGKDVYICYDNDVFQGPVWQDHKAPSEKKRSEMKLRRDAMLETAARLEVWGCNVYICKIPIDPAEKWGGDFRDWVDEGGRDFAKIPRWTLREVRVAETPKPIETSFDGAYKCAGRGVSFPAVVMALENEGITIPIRSQIDCPMGSESYCQRCRVPDEFSGGVIEWAQYLDDLIAMLLSRDPETTIRKQLLGVPTACSFCRIKPIDYVIGSEWVAAKDEREEVSDRELVVISEKSPNLSGQTRITGTVHHHKKSVVVRATNLESQDDTNIDFKPMMGDLLDICPTKSNDVDQIDHCIRRRAAEHAKYVTHIHGRTSLHVASLLLPHSALWMDIDGHKKRGWLDIAVIGDTSTGKSMTFQHMIEYTGLGNMHTCMENVSRAGLTMGAVNSGGQRMRLKPGLFPRAHKKMLVLDEFHIMVEETDDHPMLHLQSARDQGHVGGIKIYGARQLPAAVRLATISNWFGGRRDGRKFPCEHALDLYGKPEALRRLDFAFIVDTATDDDFPPYERQWNKKLEQATILRAWGQSAKEVVIKTEALEHARNQVKEWGLVYAEELPLFTGAEKVYSLLRVAIAAANICFSYDGELREVVVREGHVRWAARWFEEVWERSMYDQFSSAQFSKRELSQPFQVEAQFTCGIKIYGADQALRTLDNFFGTFSSQELATYAGLDSHKAATWSADMVRYGALEKGTAPNAYHTVWRLTRGAHTLVKNILDLANDFPDEFAQRVQKIEEWNQMRGAKGSPDIDSVEDALERRRREWNEDDEREADILSGPGSDGAG